VIVAVIILSLSFLSGCVYTHVLTPYDINLDKTVLGQKQGQASNQSRPVARCLGRREHCRRGQAGSITTVNHMDRGILNIFFGFYTKTTTIVYGD